MCVKGMTALLTMGFVCVETVIINSWQFNHYVMNAYYAQLQGIKPFSIEDNMYRTIWISDVHLGFKGCQADALVHFLKMVECEQIIWWVTSLISGI